MDDIRCVVRLASLGSLLVVRWSSRTPTANPGGRALDGEIEPATHSMTRVTCHNEPCHACWPYTPGQPLLATKCCSDGLAASRAGRYSFTNRRVHHDPTSMATSRPRQAVPHWAGTGTPAADASAGDVVTAVTLRDASHACMFAGVYRYSHSCMRTTGRHNESQQRQHVHSVNGKYTRKTHSMCSLGTWRGWPSHG